MKLNIKSKLILFILLPTAGFFILIYAIIFPQLKQYAIERNHEISSETSVKFNALIQSKIKNDTEILSTIKKAYNSNSTNSEEQIQNKLLKDLIVHNPDIKSVWILTENNQNLNNLINYKRTDKEIEFNSAFINEDNYYIQLYRNMVKLPKEVDLVINKDLSQKDSENSYFSIFVPIYNNNEIQGILGFDFNMKSLIDESNRYIDNENISVFIASKQDIYNLDVSSRNILIEEGEILNLINKAKFQVNNSLIYSNQKTKTEFSVNINPISINLKKTPFRTVVLVDTAKYNTKLNQLKVRYITLSILGLLILFILIFFISNRFFKRLRTTSSVLNSMATGKISGIKNLDTSTSDEISSLNKSLNQINLNLDKTSEFIEEIASGNFNFEYKSLTTEDKIGNSLLEMRNKLEQAKEFEIKRKEIDDRQTWATLGTAKFSEIIREHSDNLEELAYAIISDIVNYIDANQGGIFIINEDKDNQKYIELIASYAYNRRKMLSKTIPWGVGLVGRCILEKETIFMTKIPEKYLSITSGLGEKNPATLLIVPLIFHEEVFGVVELASFKEIEQYKIDLVEHISESVASAIQMVKINVRTAELLRETKIKSEQAASQEEEIRQNIEEMEAATDELNIKLEDVRSTFNALFSVAEVAVFDTSGRIIDISDSFLKLLKKEKKELIGKVQGSFSSEAQNAETFNNFWKELKRGKKMELEQIIKTDKDLLRLYSEYIPIKNSDGKVYKVISFAKQI